MATDFVYEVWRRERLAELEQEIELEKQKLRDAATKQRKSAYLRHASVRLGPLPFDSVAMRFTSRQSFYDFVQETGAGSWAIFECGKPIALLSIDNGAASHAQAYYGATVARLR